MNEYEIKTRMRIFEDYFIAGFNGLPDWITVKDYMKETEADNA